MLARLTLCAALATSAPAAAQAPDEGNDALAPGRRLQLAITGLLYGSFSDLVVGVRNNVFGPGGGVRLTVPFAQNGLLPNVDDSFGLEVGVDLYAGTPGFFPTWFLGVVPDLTLRWTFHVRERLAVYVRAGAIVDVGVGRPWWPWYVWPSLSVGVLVPLNPRLDFKAELGWPGLRVGLGFDLL